MRRSKSGSCSIRLGKGYLNRAVRAWLIHDWEALKGRVDRNKRTRYETDVEDSDYRMKTLTTERTKVRVALLTKFVE